MTKYALLFLILLNNFSFAQSDIFKFNILMYNTGKLNNDNIEYFNKYTASSFEEVEKNEIIIKKYKNNYFLIIDQNEWSGQIEEIKNTKINEFNLQTEFFWMIKLDEKYMPVRVILLQEKNDDLEKIKISMLVINDDNVIFEFRGPSKSKEIIKISELQL